MPTTAAIKSRVRAFAARNSGKPPVQRFTVIAGQNINTDIAVAGITLDDTLLSVLAFKDQATVVTDVTGEASITTDGNIQVITTNLATFFLVVVWLDLH